MADGDLDLSGVNPRLLYDPRIAQIVIEWDAVEQTSDGPRRSTNAIRLGMTLADAMLLLALLSEARTRLGLAPPDAAVTMTAVPPAKERN